jgi:hypothetical protein
MSQLNWYLPPLSGGEAKGLNDAGIESFNRSQHLARETCQNVIDAHDIHQGAVPKVEFELLQLPGDLLPGREEFGAIFSACRNHTISNVGSRVSGEDPLHKSAKAFFKQGQDALDARAIPVLRIRDLNTCGLIGDDRDAGGRWYRLVRGQGTPNLEGAGGGTKGIGQRAPFAFSGLRLVFYSTQLVDGTCRFMGKAVLCTCSHPRENVLTQNVAYYGVCGPTAGEQRVLSVTDRAEIPPFFQRTSPGTDIYIIGFTIEDWETRILRSVLSNFYAAIERETLHVTILGEELVDIGRTELVSLIERELAQAKGDERRELRDALFSAQALRSPIGGVPFTHEVARIGLAKLYVFRAPDARCQVAYMRRPGMVVYSKSSSKLKEFQGVLLVDSPEGNEYLAQLEDPGHQRWDPEEARGWTKRQMSEASGVLRELRNFVGDCLGALRGQAPAEVEDMPELAKFLPAEVDAVSDQAGLGRTPTGQHVETESPLEATIPERRPPVTVRRRAAQSAVTAQAGQGGPDSGDGGRGGGGGKGSGGDGGDGAEPGNGAGTHGGTEDAGRRLTETDLRFRSWKAGGADAARYNVVISAQESVAGHIELYAAGESGTFPIPIVTAVSAGSGAGMAVRENAILGINLAAAESMLVEVTIASRVDVALTLGR